MNKQIVFVNNDSGGDGSAFGSVSVISLTPRATTVVGGEILGLDITSFFIAGAAANVGWIIPIAGVTAGAAIIGIIVTRRFR